MLIALLAIVNRKEVSVLPEYFTSGQAAQKLRISVTTLKRWIRNAIDAETRNASGWMPFSETDMHALKKFKNAKRRNGKVFKAK